MTSTSWRRCSWEGGIPECRKRRTPPISWQCFSKTVTHAHPGSVSRPRSGRRDRVRRWRPSARGEGMYRSGRLALSRSNRPLSVRGSSMRGLRTWLPRCPSLALGLLRADPAGDRGQHVVLANLAGGPPGSPCNQLDEVLTWTPTDSPPALGRGVMETRICLGAAPSAPSGQVHFSRNWAPPLASLFVQRCGES